VGIIFGEDEGFGDVLAVWEDLREEPLSEGLYDEPNLLLGDHVPVELIGGVGEVVIELGVAPGPGATVAPGHVGLTSYGYESFGMQ
jgi:hypothetical protein